MKNTHPLQSEKWGTFREKTGVKVIFEKDFILTIHPIPKTKYTIGYFPKGALPNKEMLSRLYEIGKKEKAIFIQLEPNVENNQHLKTGLGKLGLVPSTHPLFTKYNFILDITKPEEELLKNMNQKTRYNIRLAQKKGVIISEERGEGAFEEYLKLTKETTRRQKFYAHSQTYHRLMWETLKTQEINTEELSAHLLTANYNGETLAAWILFVLGDTLYYPYGASSSKFREVMASNLLMWEAIKFGKKLGLKKFDMWGALGENPDIKDPWFGFHKFKQGYGPKHTEYIGSYDFVINRNLYFIYKLLDKVRWAILKLK
jgi:lipid II:glycine glycyltransferase (peptidoglycan interpeptide bridge formation enzyme)